MNAKLRTANCKRSGVAARTYLYCAKADWLTCAGPWQTCRIGSQSSARLLLHQSDWCEAPISWTLGGGNGTVPSRGLDRMPPRPRNISAECTVPDTLRLFFCVRESAETLSPCNVWCPIVEDWSTHKLINLRLILKNHPLHVQLLSSRVMACLMASKVGSSSDVPTGTGLDSMQPP